MIYLNKNQLILMNKFNLKENVDEPLNLTKEDFFWTLNQSYPLDEEISRTKEIF